MGNEFNYKSKGVRTSDPFPKDSIPMHKINWEVSQDRCVISLYTLKFLEDKKYDDPKYELGIYAYDGSNDYLFNKNLNEISDFPIVFNIKKYGFDELKDTAKFEVFIFDPESKRRIAETKPIKLVPNNTIENLLEVRAKDLGKRIAQVDINSDGPVLFYNKHYITKRGNLNRKKIESIIESDPVFMCAYFPEALDKIFSHAFLNKSKDPWAKKWMEFGKDLVPGAFKDINSKKIDSIDDLENYDDFQDELIKITDAWIKRFDFDKNLFSKFNNENND